MHVKFGLLIKHIKCTLQISSASYCEGSIMRVLNVAEKNDAAKNIASYLSNGSSRRRDGFSKYNKIYEFDYNVFGQRCKMLMTSVSGHLLNYEFIGTYKKWTACSPEDLFEAPVVKMCSPDFEPIKRTLESEARPCDALIIWTDCDREGENIGFEVIDTCTKINPRLSIYRAKFSEITAPSIRRAIDNLAQPNRNISDAVDVRQQLDLRIGASFTRFQTLRLQKVFPVLAQNLLSYGSCQFPTLGFVVERYLERERFISEPFWRIRVTHKIDDLIVEFRWARDRLFDEMVCRAILARCLENPLAKVERIEGKPKSKWRPNPLDTTEMEKIASRKLKINAKEALRIAEKLYTQGFISYPRTETNIFPDSINLTSLVEIQTEDPNWGGFARGILQCGPCPRQGKKSDQSHPPIHPIKYAHSLGGNEARMYEFIVRHFLACVSKDAKGHETTVKIDINQEKFTASGLMILERNYLDVYPYENWSAKEIHRYTEGQTFRPTVLDVAESRTTAPNLLTEADLIALMEKHGIGTDATHADHIETIKSRCYVGLENNVYFIPSAVGMGLVEGYDTMGFAMSKPGLRAELEADLKRICDGVKPPDSVLREQINKYRELFRKAKEQVNKIDAAIGKYIQATALPLSAEEDPLAVVAERSLPAMPCPLCGIHMVLRRHQDTFFLSCSAYPACRASVWFPSKVQQAVISDEACPTCGPNVKKLIFNFSAGSMAPYYPQNYRGCVNGCDQDFIEMLGIRLPRQPSAGFNNSSQTVQRNANINHRTSDSFSGSTNNFSVNNRGDNNFRPPPDNPSRRGGGGGESGQKRPRYDFFDGGAGGAVCLCSLPAKRLTARQGNNAGRDFLICSKDTDDKCNYYMWADEMTDIKCLCNLAAKKLTVRKDGPNQGRQFYSCSKGQHEKCNFFQWDEPGSGSVAPIPPAAINTWNQQPQAPRNNNLQNRNNFRAQGNNQQGNRRKCSVCKETGHTKRNCPQNQGD